METKQVKIEERLQNNLKAAFEFCLKHNLVVNGETITDVEKYHATISESELNQAVVKCSMNRRKKLVKSLRRLEFKPTLKSVNLFFHFIHTKLNLPIKVKVSKSFKEQEIDSLREQYKELMKKTEEMRLIFKEKKKGFYTV